MCLSASLALGHPTLCFHLSNDNSYIITKYTSELVIVKLQEVEIKLFVENNFTCIFFCIEKR